MTNARQTELRVILARNFSPTRRPPVTDKSLTFSITDDRVITAYDEKGKEYEALLFTDKQLAEPNVTHPRDALTRLGLSEAPAPQEEPHEATVTH